MARTRAQEQQQHQDAINELDQILRQDAKNQRSATKIQKAIRGHKARREIPSIIEDQLKRDKINEINDKYIKSKAAATIQNAVRGHNAMNETIKRAKQKTATREKTASQISKQTLDDAMNEIVNEDVAATTISSALRGHKGRQTYHFDKNVYPQQAAKRQLEGSNTEPSTQLQFTPKTKTSYTRNVDTKKGIIKEKYEKELINIQN